MEKKETVEKHLKNQIKKGAKWAKTALELTNETNKQYRCDGPKEALLMAFAWADTEQGYIFWDNIYKSL